MPDGAQWRCKRQHWNCTAFFTNLFAFFGLSIAGRVVFWNVVGQPDKFDVGGSERTCGGGKCSYGCRGRCPSGNKGDAISGKIFMIIFEIRAPSLLVCLFV